MDYGRHCNLLLLSKQVASACFAPAGSSIRTSGTSQFHL